MNKWWRPTKLNDDTIQKLKEAFKLDCTVLEACYYADISKSAYYDWIWENKEFMDEIMVSKKYLELKSRQIIASSIEIWDVKTAMWYLERKRRKEFSINYIVEEKKLEENENPCGKLLEKLNLNNK